MLNLTQPNSGSKPMITADTEKPLATKADAQPEASELDAQREDNKSAAAIETETPITPQENGTQAEATSTMTVTQAPENEPAVQPCTEPSDNTGAKELEPASKTSDPSESGPETHTNPGQKSQKQNKSVRDGRKYVPSKKAMVDPLKLDMSKPLPLSPSQLSLQCMDCHIIFSDHKSKERHLKLTHPLEYEHSILRNALFACYVCDRHFTNSAELMAHQKAHTERKPFKCPICGQAFNKSSELTHHKKVHFGLDGYACTDCGKSCKTMTLLKYHRRTHTGERPYVCKECGKRFTMSKALQKHAVLHLPEGAQQQDGDTAAKAQLKKDANAGTKYPCSVCKATFKTTKTRLHHMKTKHSASPVAASHALPAGQQLKLNTPIITPISICQPGLLQVDPNGPLQKVDANIDTEEIRKLIESLGNVQKVNQVVILGQVPPHAPPLDVQLLSRLTEPVNLNISPPHMDFAGIKKSDSKTVELDPSKNPCDPMEQTIILEPITPDGQLENPPFSELGSQIAVGGNIELTLVPVGQMERPEGGEVMQQIIQQSNVIQSNPVDQMVCQTEEEVLKENLEQTVILELTPALLSTVELEQTQMMSQNQILSSSLAPVTELEKTPPDQTPHQTMVHEEETVLSVPAELELTPLQGEPKDLPPCPSVPPDTITQSESESNPKAEADSQTKTPSVDEVHHMMVAATPQGAQEGTEKEQPEQKSAEKAVVEKLENKDQTEKLSGAELKEVAPSKAEATKQMLQISELPVNVMSAQELVKVRKRKPARAFIFQGYMQELVGSMRKEDLPSGGQPAKRQRAKKTHLVVKFGPQNKEKKKKKQKTPSQQRPRTKEDVIKGKRPRNNLLDKNVALQKKGPKGKKEKKTGQLASTAEIKLPPSTQDAQLQQIKGDLRKNKNKKRKEMTTDGIACVSEHKTEASLIFKKKKQAKIMQKSQAKNKKGTKQKKNLTKEESVKLSLASTDTPFPHKTQDALLLLKGHKQPQLKVYKLDTLKASGQTQEASPLEGQTMSQESKDNKLKHPTSEAPNNLPGESKKKVGRPKRNQKALSLLSPLQFSQQPPEKLPNKPKSSRKRKASSKVETEGVITSNSKRALECQDCGERFSEVSSLQKHKATVHIMESPGLTYTNGNIFEGVSKLDLYNYSKQHEKIVGVMNAAADWDTEPELGELVLEGRERNVSFPALNPSPSLPFPSSDVEVSAFEDKSVGPIGADDQCHTTVEVLSPSDEGKSSGSPQREIPDLRKLDENVCENSSSKSPSTGAQVQGTMDEDVKEDLLLDVNLVTVGEQIEGDDPESTPQTESNELNCESVGGSSEQAAVAEAEQRLSSQTVSCSTHRVEVKEEEEEVLVQKTKEGRKRAGAINTARGRRRGAGCLKKDMLSKGHSGGNTVTGAEPEQELEECSVIYEKQCVDSDLRMDVDGETGTEMPKLRATPQSSPRRSVASTLEEPAEEQVVFELESITTSVDEVMNDREVQEGEEHDRDHSPVIILEKFLISRQRANADKELCMRTRKDHRQEATAEGSIQSLGRQEIKVEENIPDPTLVAASCQNRQSAPPQHRDIRTVLVKEESTLVLNEVQGSRRIRWNVEPVNNENTSSPFLESEEPIQDCCVTTEFNTSQCIFYPVKEEEREVLLGANSGRLTPGASCNTLQTEHQPSMLNLSTSDEGSTSDYQEMRVRGMVSEPVVSDFTNGQAAAEADWQHPPDLRDFLLQSSDEEDVGASELSDPQLDSEAEIMSYYYKNQPGSVEQPETSHNSPASARPLQTQREENITRKPINYFSQYFGWDTWLEIASCTNNLSNITKPVTAREIAQFVGIHIAMGTLKFPSLRLYWEDLTRVPLVADAMSLPRFLELSRILKLADHTMDPLCGTTREERHDSDLQNRQQSKSLPRSPNEIPQCSNAQRLGNTPYDPKRLNAETDPLWKAQPLLHRFKAGCQLLKRDGDYAIDQYPLPLTVKSHSKKHSLCCTTSIGFGGFLLHVDLSVGLSSKEGAVEKMVPKGSMVFLCKQELSTPAMLERLLVAGVHGAGRVGGARGQIGDEFVSSDGKLMLRRSHCDFILSTAGNSHRNMTSLNENFEKAQMSAHLNRDLLKLYSIPVTALAPTCWPQAVLWYLTDQALVNSWLLYRKEHRSTSTLLTLMAFRLEVSKTLILSSGSDTQDSVPPQPPIERRSQATNETPNPTLVEESPLPDASTRYDGKSLRLLETISWTRMDSEILNIEEIVMGRGLPDPPPEVPPEKPAEPYKPITLNGPPAPPVQSYQHENLQCFQCFITFCSAKAKERHMKKSHREEYKQQLQQGNTLFTCYVCDRTFPSSEELTQHQPTHSKDDKPFKCVHCKESFKTFSELTAHRRQVCPERQLVCKDCNETFRSAGLLRAHRLTQHPRPDVEIAEQPEDSTKSHRCKKCGQGFETESELTVHQEKYPEGQQCNGSASSVKKRGRPSKAEDQAAAEKKGKRKKKDEAEAPEEAVKASSTSEPAAASPPVEEKGKTGGAKRGRPSKATGAAVAAVKSEAEDKKTPEDDSQAQGKEKKAKAAPAVPRQHPCPECDLAFPGLIQLRAHKKEKHTPRKAHPCEECEESFARPEQLDAHMSRAHAVGRFACATCGKSFGRERTLKAHEKSHPEEKPDNPSAKR
ncbi:uncharacterized protein V6R79_012807 [Siganus canaliculatus]